MFRYLLVIVILGTLVKSLDLPPLHQKILEEVSWSLKLKLLEDYVESRTSVQPRLVGLQAFVIGGNENNGFGKSWYLNKIQGESQHIDQEWQDDYKSGRRQGGSSTPSSTQYPREDEENSMRMKLFRLMYETVRDSDLKVKRAELIKTHYRNSSVFDIGFIMGDITDKFNIMSDISTTLKRLYLEWKPIEHINAYEQIANQAIEISHLIDMMRHIGKRSNLTM